MGNAKAQGVPTGSRAAQPLELTGLHAPRIDAVSYPATGNRWLLISSDSGKLLPRLLPALLSSIRDLEPPTNIAEALDMVEQWFLSVNTKNTKLVDDSAEHDLSISELAAALEEPSA